jgi:hypothetical protein
MNATEMADRIVKAVDDRGKGVSFVEIMDSVGPEAKGNRMIGCPEMGVVSWSGVSELFAEGLQLAEGRIEQRCCSLMVYALDGVIQDLPIARHMPKKAYKEPHWLPIAFDSKGGRNG